MKRRERTRRFYQSLSFSSRRMLEAAIFCFFAPMGFVSDIVTLGSLHWLSVTLLVLMSGGVAILYARSGFTGRFKTYVAAGLAIQFAVTFLLGRFALDAPVPATLDAAGVDAVRARLRADTILLVGFVVTGYSLFITVFMREGSAYFARNTEIRLAQRIHQRLVPPLEGRNGDAEWAGTSRPSGDIGGDLIDVVEGSGGLVGCVADVSGHGVGAGLLMGMFKTAFHSSVTRLSDPAELLADIHVTLSPLTEPNMFATAGVLRVTRGTLQYAGAGHPPLLLYRRAQGTVDEIASTGPAVALLDDFVCGTVALDFTRGDIALLLTDGIVEAVDANEREVGLEPIKQLLIAHADRPLPDLLARVAALQPDGTRQDDQTVLIVRAL